MMILLIVNIFCFFMCFLSFVFFLYIDFDFLFFFFFFILFFFDFWQTAMATIHDNIRAGDLAAVQKHLSYGVSPDTKDAAGISALHFAVGVALSCITNLFSIFHTIQTFCIFVLHVGCFILDAFPFDRERADPAESSCSFVEKFSPRRESRATAQQLTVWTF